MSATQSFWPPVSGSTQVGPAAALADLYTLSGVDQTKSQYFTHQFDNLAGWFANGGSNPVAVTESDGAFVRTPAATDYIGRGTAATVYSNPMLLDQNTPWAAMAVIRFVTSGSFLLFGVGGTTHQNEGILVGVTGGDFVGWHQVGAGASTTIVSTIPVDGAWHRVYVYAPGDGHYYFKVDNETATVMSDASPFTNTPAFVKLSYNNQNDIAFAAAVWPTSWVYTS